MLCILVRILKYFLEYICLYVWQRHRRSTDQKMFQCDTPKEKLYVKVYKSSQLGFAQMKEDDLARVN